MDLNGGLGRQSLNGGRDTNHKTKLDRESKRAQANALAQPSDSEGGRKTHPTWQQPTTNEHEIPPNLSATAP